MILINTSQICHQESILREDCTSKNYTIKILVENLPKHTNSFCKVNQENINPSYTDVHSQNDQLFLSRKNSIKINNRNANRSIDVTINNFVSKSHFSVLNCEFVLTLDILIKQSNENISTSLPQTNSFPKCQERSNFRN